MKTKRFRILTVLLILVIFWAMSLNIFAATGNVVTKDGLTAQLFTDKDAYKTGESVKAGVQVDNHTGREVFIFAQVNAPESVKLAGETNAFDTRLKDGETWTTPGGVTLSAADVAAGTTATSDNMQAGFWVILTVFAVAGIIALFVYGKNKKTWLSVMLCMAMVAGMVVTAVPTQAADMNGDIELSCTIQVDGKDTELSATVSYVIYDDAEEAADESTTAPTEAPTTAPTEAPTAAPTTAPTEAPTTAPTEAPTAAPTEAPTAAPTEAPTAAPTEAPTTAPNTVILYSDNFNETTSGQNPKVDACTDQDVLTLRVVENATKKIFARIAKDGDNGYLRVYAEEGGQGGGPRLDYMFDSTKLQDMTMTLKVKSDGQDPKIIVHDTDGNTTLATLGPISATDWTDVRIELDFKQKKATVYVSGEKTQEKTLNMQDGKTKYEIRFAGSLQPGQATCFDDVKITTTRVYEAVQPEEPNVDPTVIPFEPTGVPNMVSVPEGAYVFLNQDFSDAQKGEASKSGVFSAATPYADILDVGGNALLRFWSTAGTSKTPRVQQKLLAEVDTYVLDYAFMFSEGSYLNIVVCEDSTTKATVLDCTKIGNLRYDVWNYAHVEIDLNALTATVRVNGGDTITSTINEITNRDAVNVRLYSLIDPGEVVYIDAVTLYTEEEYHYDGILLGNNQVAWENVKPTNTISDTSYVKNIKDHPRIIVHNWDEMRERVDLSYEAKQWYQNIKDYADSCLTGNMAEYVINSRGNILESAREAQGRLMSLSFMYKMTNDTKYLDRAIAEMQEYGTWPDWSGFVSTLVTAEAMFGYACMYDWLYDDLTPEQKQEMIAIVKKLGLPDFIYDYEEKSGVAIATNNWNPVCNGTMLATAFAFADEEPALSEYIFERAPENIIISLHAYAPKGATDEGVGYWDYGTGFLCMAMDMLDNGFEDDFELDEKYKYYTYPGISETGDFPIYYGSSVGAFDYGDVSMGSGGIVSEAHYWLANKFNKPQYAWYANKTQQEQNSYFKPDAGSYIMAYKPIFALANYDPNNASVEPGVFTLDCFYDAQEGTSGMSMRSSWYSDKELYAAMEGGYTTVYHMNYSLGTYVVDYGGTRFVDEDVTSDYAITNANEKENVYYRRAEGHNTLVINLGPEADQTPGAGAFVVRSGSSDNTAFGILDMTATNEDYVSAKRGMIMTDNRSRVIVQDEVVAKEPSEFYWFANTKANIKIAPDGRSVLLERDGARMLLRMIEAPTDARFEVMERKSMIDGVINNQNGYKLYVHMTDVQSLNFAVEYVGLKAGEGIPMPSAFVPMDNWTADDNGLTTVASVGDAIVLKLNTPNAIAKGEKTYVDENNYNAVPLKDGERILVPVRFISEALGAMVDWDDATQTLSVNYHNKEIKLVIGSDQMLVNGQGVSIGEPVNTYNSTVLIPLNVLAEALDKYASFDNDSELIVIKNDEAAFDDAVIDRLVKELNIRVTVNGQDITFFELERKNYTLNVKSGEAVPQIGITTIGDETVLATQATSVGESASVTVDDVTYTFKIEMDTFENVPSNKDAGILYALLAKVEGRELPSYLTYIYVEDLTDSTGFATYPKRGIVDGVINTQIANRWACNGEGWIQMDFGSVQNVYSMAFAGVSQNVRAYNFDVQVSNDGENWETVHTGGAPTTTDIMSIIPLGDVQARYVRLNGHGSNQGTWNTYAEVRFYTSEAQQNEDKSLWETYFISAGLSGNVGESNKIKLRGIDAMANEFELSSNAQITYQVTDESIATVAEDGSVTYKKTGATTVRITVVQDGYKVMAIMPIEVL